jgi:Pyruvate/2-oxoacid:ferredoxin oxidoreductase delta subunit
MELPIGYDNWKLASPEDDADCLVECEECDAMVPEDELIPVNDTTIDYTPKVCEECAW